MLIHSVGSNSSCVSQLNWFQSSIQDLIDLPVGEISPRHPWYTNDDIRLPEEIKVAKPLHIAASVGDARTVKFLLQKGANINTTDTYLRTPLHYAAATHNTTIIGLLLSFGANIHAVEKLLKTACIVAVLSDRLGPLRIMTARGADLQARDVLGKTALYHAAAQGYMSVIPFLFTNSGDVTQGCHDPIYYTPASLMIPYGTRHELQFLLNLAPDPKVYSDGRANCLTACVQNQYMTRSLMEKFIRRISRPTAQRLVHQRGSVGGTPLYAACTLTLPHQQEYLIEVLLELGADLEQEGGDHGTPLMGASAAGRLTAVKILVSKGAKIVYSNCHGAKVSALDVARYFPDIVRWLLVDRYTQGPKWISK